MEFVWVKIISLGSIAKPRWISYNETKLIETKKILSAFKLAYHKGKPMINKNDNKHKNEVHKIRWSGNIIEYHIISDIGQFWHT